MNAPALKVAAPSGDQSEAASQSLAVEVALTGSIDLSELVSRVAEQAAGKVLDQLREMLELSRRPNVVDGDQLAEVLGISRASIDRMAKAKAIPFLQSAGGRRYVLDDVIDRMKQN